MSARVLVTGASGFVGRAVVTALADRGQAVRAAARRPADVPRAPNVTTVGLPDLAEPFDWRPFLTGVDTVVHLAGLASRAGIEDATYDRVVRAATGDLARAIRAEGAGRMIFTSAIVAQTGPPGSGVTEADATEPVNAHDRAKLAAEAEIAEAGIPFTILRPALVYGPGVKGTMALLARIATSPWPLPDEAFAKRRSLLALENLVAAILFCLDDPATIDQTYVVADRDPITIAEMITILRAAAGDAPTSEGAPPAAFEILMRASERNALWERIGRDLVVDPGKLLAAGWRPPVEVRAGLRAMVRSGPDGEA